jgi:tripartite-type tricarboxylate transporter receptor subunit TctC
MLTFASAPSLAEPYPSRPIRLVVGQPPGGHSDALGRMVAQRFSEILKQPVVVENRAGASGTIAAEAVARAPADGYTLLFAGSNNLSLAALTIGDLRYDPLDFAPVGMIGRVSYGLAVNAKLPIASMTDLVRYARANPRRLNYGSGGVTSTSRLAFELLKKSANIEVEHIPLRGSALAVGEITSGRIDLLLVDISVLMPHVHSGALRLIAGARPLRGAADVRTFAEQGYPEVALEPWYGIFAPAGTPAEIIATLNQTLVQMLRTPEIRQRFDRLDFLPLESTPDELGAILRAEMKTFGPLVERIKVNPQP